MVSLVKSKMRVEGGEGKVEAETRSSTRNGGRDSFREYFERLSGFESGKSAANAAWPQNHGRVEI